MFLIKDKWVEEFNLKEIKVGEIIQAKVLHEQHEILFSDREKHIFHSWYFVEREGNVVRLKKPIDLLGFKTYNINKSTTYTREAVHRLRLANKEEISATVKRINQYFPKRAKIYVDYDRDGDRIKNKSW